MWNVAHFDYVDPVTRVAGAALICNLLTQGLSSQQAELCSETLAWMILPILFQVARGPDSPKLSRTLLPSHGHAQPAFTASLWVFGIGVAVFSIFKAEKRHIELFPALTPLLLAVQRYFASSEIQAPPKPESWLFFPFVNTVWGTALVAFFAVVTLSDWDLGSYALSAIPVVALLVAYVTLTPRVGKSSRYLPAFDIEQEIFHLSLFVVVLLVVLLGAETAIFNFPRSDILITFTLGIAKALNWYFLVQVSRQSSWSTATVIETFSIISTCNPFAHAQSGGQPSSHIIGALLTLGQIIHLLPKQAKGKAVLWIFSLVSSVPYLVNTLAVTSAQSSLLHSHAHPIESLIRNAHGDFNFLLQRQSQNYKAAHDEYRRRYGVVPPPGFEAWYYFAGSHESPIIDDFDIIYDTLAPFWKLSGQQVRDLMISAHNTPNSDLWLCTFSGAKAKTQCNHHTRSFDRNVQLLFDKLLGDMPGVLADVKFLVNHLDEPRVLTPPPSSPEEKPGQFDINNLTRQPVWDTLTKFCIQDDPKRPVEAGPITETFGLPFVTDLTWAMDLCHHPEYSRMHGLAMSPTSLLLIQSAVPVLSTGSVSTMGDILYPSPAYLEPGFQYTATRDIDWDRKRNNLYWAGSTTGAFAGTNTDWRFYHRQRFVELAQNLAPWAQHHYLRQGISGVIYRVQSFFFNSRLFDVSFTRIFQCEPRQCRDQRMHFHTRSWEDKDQALRSRFVFDLDGNGISGRYYKLLASGSVPLKQTLLREWHDERLVPWVHYIPVSQSMGELPEMMLYLTSSPAGQKRAREIAENGRVWFPRAFRKVDMTIYTYRLLLELARLQDPDRSAS